MEFQTTDNTKLQRQNLGAEKWIQNDGIGTLNYSMRFGKTYCGIICIKEALNKLVKCDELPHIIILSPSEIIKKNWDKYIDDNITFSATISNVTINEALNFGDCIDCDVLIVDEIHKFTSEERYKIFDRINFKHILGLTGTYPSGKDASKLNKYCPVIDVITEEEALKNKWISNFIEYNIPLQLNEEDKERYIKFSIPIKETLELFRGCAKLLPSIGNDDYEIITACFAGKKHQGGYTKSEHIREALAIRKGWSVNLSLSNDYNKMINRYWNPVAIERTCREFNDIVRRRNDIIINNKIKLDAVLEIFNTFSNTTICFNESTEFADNIRDAINMKFAELPNILAVSYHSKVQSTLMMGNDGKIITTKAGKPKVFGQQSIKKNVIEGVKQGKYKFLSTARALDEGLDIPNIENVICTAGTTNPIQYMQRTARGKTVDIYNPNKITKIFNLYFDDFLNGENMVYSRDLQKLKLRQSKTQNPVEWLESMEQVKLLKNNS